MGRVQIDHVLGIDPGGTTGVALLEVSPLRIVVAAQYSTVDMFANLRSLVKQADLVTIERFTISSRTLKLTRQPDALYMIGATALICYEETITLELESPANAKSAFPDEMLKLHGVYPVGKHARDAVRHALIALRRHKLLSERV